VGPFGLVPTGREAGVSLPVGPAAAVKRLYHFVLLVLAALLFFLFGALPWLASLRDSLLIN
jgi:hypothetical protein